MDKRNISAKTAIDRQLGLDRYEGDKKIYENVLENFGRNNKDTLMKLSVAVDTGDRKLAHRTAHSLRGAAGTIGATRLATAALRIENRLSPANAKSGSIGGEAFDKELALLEDEYNAVFDELNLHSKERKETCCDSCVMCRKKTLELIEKLTPLLEAGDAGSLEYLDEINESFRSAAEGFNLFAVQMERYDFEQAYETMDYIRQFMGL